MGLKLSEIREIEEAIKLSPQRELFELKQLSAVQIDDLRRALLDFKPEIVHFSGHGLGVAGLAFESKEGKTQLFPTQAISNLFKLVSKNVKCVLLSACFSEEQAKSIVQHINYVIGMRIEIGERALIKFYVGFYDAISREEPVDIAYEFGCNAITEYNIPEGDIPVLLKKSETIETEQKNKNWNELENSKHQSEQNKVSQENIVELRHRRALLQIPSSTIRKLTSISYQIQELFEQVSVIKKVLNLQSNPSQVFFKNINPLTASTQDMYKIIITIKPSSQISIVEINKISKFSRELDENLTNTIKPFSN